MLNINTTVLVGTLWLTVWISCVSVIMARLMSYMAKKNSLGANIMLILVGILTVLGVIIYGSIINNQQPNILDPLMYTTTFSGSIMVLVSMPLRALVNTRREAGKSLLFFPVSLQYSGAIILFIGLLLSFGWLMVPR